MPSSDITSRYSCRRKRDWITFSAVSMFVLLVIFQLYLVFVVPVQLKRASFLEREVAKDAMALKMDNLRDSIRRFKPDDKTNAGEAELVRGVLNELAQFMRDNQDSLDLAQISEMTGTIGKFESLTARWKAAPPRFCVAERKFDLSACLDAIEKKANGENTHESLH